MADHPAHGVTPLLPQDYSVAGAVLSRAFLDDPLWVALLPDRGTRREGLARMFTGLARATAAAGGVTETTRGLEAFAMWLGPGKELGLWATVRSGMALPRFAMRLPASNRRRMLTVLGQLDRRRKELVPEPHWYLAAVGVDPDEQGAGLGTLLVRAGMSRAQHDNTPVYLETETEANVGYYERLGFDIVEQTIATGLDLPIWLMIRRPADSDDPSAT